MMQAWTPEGMAFLQDAMACCGYYPALARRIAPYLPKQAHVCDAGCGLGGLSVALLPYCRHVTAVDRVAAPLENLRQRAGHDPRLTVRQGDIRCLPPETPYDAMVFCLFGDVEEALTVARQQCRGTVLLIRRDYAYHRFSTGRVPVGFTAADSEDTLRHLGLSYRMERFSLEFGQPLRSLEDARRFFRLYDRSGGADPPLHRLTAGPGPEFPYYLPNRKELCLLAVEIPAMEKHILICGERGVGKSTLIRRLLAESTLPVGGFVTRRLPQADGDGMFPIYLHAAALPPEERPYDPEHLVGTCDSRRSIRYPEVFDRLGPPLLTSGGLLVMDELGFLENDAHRFQAAVLAALDGPVPVLAAIKPKETDFLRRVRQHPHGEVFNITPESREALYQRLRSRILQWNKEKL